MNAFIKKIVSLLSVLAVVLLASCDRNQVYEKNIDMPDYVWDVQNKPSFEVDIEDTLTHYNFYANVRHVSHYPYANLYLFVTIHFPNQKTATDTLECILADPSGKWKGSGMGDIWDNSILWKENVKFPLKGKYTFEFEHAMRIKQVPFIMDVGLRVEKRESKKEQ